MHGPVHGQGSGQQAGPEFGADVVSRTIDHLHNVPPSAQGHAPGSSASVVPMDQQTFGAAVVDKTLEYMNYGQNAARGDRNGMSQTYDFAKNVLGAHATGRGAIANIIA
ncbi:MAG: hypothetical protein EA399_06925 [Desulfovibrionales bacterium]|nr:MAG: hypothetical protein EA399_06925 [Desulfovibrionales bacterium]